MARDRLAAMRAAQQGGNQGYGQEPAPPSMPSGPQGGGYQSQPPQQHSYPSARPEPSSHGGGGGGAGAGAGGRPGAGGGYGGQQGSYDAGGRGYSGYDSKGSHGGGESYEMQPPANGRGPQNLDSFMNEMSSLNDGLKSISFNVDNIRDLHSRALGQLDESQHAQTTAQLQSLTAETSRMTNSIKNRIKTLEGQNAKLPPGEDANVRRQQVGSLKKRFMDIIQKYQSVEQESRQKYRQRMERQYKIVKPDATESEIRQAVESDDGGQVFSQALLNSNRYGDARAAYREVQERHEDIRKIEKTLTELMQMFNDLATMVENDDQMITNIEQNATGVETDMEQANVQMGKAKKSAKAARRKRWICFWIIVAILIAIAIIVALVVLNANHKL